jgi:Tfp pilus assembly protein PilN
VATLRPNLARRPFVDSRPANAASVLLVVLVIVLTAISVRTVHAYIEGSESSRQAIASLRAEIERLEAGQRDAQQKLARFDLEGMQAGAEEANALARLRAFSWSRFLTRLEKTLPNDVRIASIGLARNGRTGSDASSDAPSDADAFRVTLSLVSRDPDALPRLLRIFYASPWFETPTPVSETGGERGSVDGRSLSLVVRYHDREARP